MIHCLKVHRELVIDNWLCCDTCTKYFPDENVMALHNSHTHNKVVKVDQGLDDPSQMDDLDGDTTIKLVRNPLIVLEKKIKHVV